jgi:hypothetical protein
MSQFANVPLHAYPHDPPAHARVEFEGVPHELPQRPQLFTSVAFDTSHPSVALPLQSTLPGLHAYVQRPLAQTGAEFGRDGHIVPQVPQFARSERRSTSQPSFALPLQLAKFGRQAASEHVPLPHVPMPLEYEHAMLHRPQCIGSAERFASQPFAALPSQSAYPALHEPIVQRKFVHAAVAFGSEQTVPQPPQFEGCVMSVSQPLLDMPSQFAVPVGHMLPT